MEEYISKFDEKSFQLKPFEFTRFADIPQKGYDKKKIAYYDTYKDDSDLPKVQEQCGSYTNLYEDLIGKINSGQKIEDGEKNLFRNKNIKLLIDGYNSTLEPSDNTDEKVKTQKKNNLKNTLLLDRSKKCEQDKRCYFDKSANEGEGECKNKKEPCCNNLADLESQDFDKLSIIQLRNKL